LIHRTKTVKLLRWRTASSVDMGQSSARAFEIALGAAGGEQEGEAECG
jgi:hypothetical protein